jgi:hypothetical protein
MTPYPRQCERSEAIQNLSAVTVWIAHMGIWCVKVDVQLFVRLQPAFRPDRRVFQMARTDRVKVGPEGRREAA